MVVLTVVAIKYAVADLAVRIDIAVQDRCDEAPVRTMLLARFRCNSDASNFEALSSGLHLRRQERILDRERHCQDPR